jgi:hypothetical protein
MNQTNPTLHQFNDIVFTEIKIKKFFSFIALREAV